MTLSQYIDKINTLYKTGNAREHSYRGDLQNLIMSILPDVLVTNEPARVDCGAPDYVLTRKDVPVGYIEAKDIGVDLGSKTLKEQFDRYKSGLSNLIFTDYMDFHFYKDGELTTKIAIATLRQAQDGKSVEIVPIPENFDQFNQLIKNFAETISQTIKSPTKLAQMMAGKARLMADVIEKSLNHDDQEGKRSQLKSQMLSFQQMLIHDIDNKAFSDIYAQTIAYGMFAARYHDPTLPTFSRMEAAELIPKSNPFLRKLFQDIAGFDLDTRLTWIVDELVNIFLASDVATIMKNFGKSTKQEDPVVHFYETFLGEYNPALRKARGVWYTPQPVVNFIVRAVDDILKTEFNLPQGLADTSKTKIKKKTVTQTGTGANSKIKEVETETEVHKVQILDPATGTGTFLAEVVKHIHKKFEGQQGIWSKYVTNDLIPRLNGFELLMASYAMAHLKMDMLLTETGYKPTDDQRFKIFLTNSLEEAHPDTQTLFSSWLSDEADQANTIKRDSPVMVVIGNPPYSGISSNNGEWIQNLIEDYKYIDGEHFKERKHWLNDDYVKFMRFGQHFIDKNGEGVLAFINPHGFLDNPTFRGMRWNLMQSFDKIYTIDLHGNSTKKETAPDGSVDQNVFDIMQGVSINLFIKTGKKKKNELSQIFHYDLFGKRDFKYNFLSENPLKSISFTELKPEKPNVFFIPKDNFLSDNYNKGFYLGDLFLKQSMGITTARDFFVVDITQDKLIQRIKDFSDLSFKDDVIRMKYFGEKKSGKYLAGDTRGWNLSSARLAIQEENHLANIKKIAYRIFDNRFIYYSKKMIDWGREDVMKNLLKENLSLVTVKIGRNEDAHNYFISNLITDKSLTSSLDNANVFPLYIYTDNSNQQTLDGSNGRVPNIDKTIANQIAKGIGAKYVPDLEDRDYAQPPEGLDSQLEISPLSILDYIYAVLHSPTYRETYKEFLKIDFPRVPYPKDRATFWQLVKLGGELRQIHLLESSTVEKYITQYPNDGNNVVGKIHFENNRVYINYDKASPLGMEGLQYFANVPEVAWNFYIGGYQPAQKWLKDRKDRELSTDDIFHYQKIIVALSETDRIMKEIDKIEI